MGLACQYPNEYVMHCVMETDKACAAAWLEGEGCITITRRMGKHSVNASYGLAIIISNNDRRMCEWLQARWGGSIQSVRGKGQRLHICYRWQIGAGVAAQFLKDVQPYLIIKHDQVTLALRFQEHMAQPRSTPDLFAEREGMRVEMMCIKNAHHQLDL